MQIYRLHVSLQDIKPMIWRRIEVSSETTLKQFHRILQIAMGWENCHLHEYIVDGRRYATPDPNYELSLPQYSQRVVQGTLPYWVADLLLAELP